MMPLLLYMFVLQIPVEGVKESISTINEYGILGAFSVIGLVALFFLIRYVKSLYDKSQKSYEYLLSEFQKVQTEFRTFIIDDNSKLREIILENNEVLKKNTEAMINFSRIIEKIIK